MTFRLAQNFYCTQRSKTKIISNYKRLTSYPKPLQVILSSGAKQPLPKVTHLPAFSATFLNEWSWWSHTSPHALMAWTETAFSFVLNHGFKIKEQNQQPPLCKHLYNPHHKGQLIF
jgi:hypothetical protein